jgi:hypothetical protein
MKTTNQTLTPELLADRLDGLLNELGAQYEALHKVLDDHRLGMLSGEPAQLARAVDGERIVMERLKDVDKHRRELTATAAANIDQIGAMRGKPVTLTHLVAATPGNRRPDLASRAARVKDMALKAAERSQALRSATADVLTHIEGVMRQIGHRMSHTATYSQRGVVEARGTVVSALDART